MGRCRLLSLPLLYTDVQRLCSRYHGSGHAKHLGSLEQDGVSTEGQEMTNYELTIHFIIAGILCLVAGFFLCLVARDIYRKFKNPPVQDPFKPLAKWDPELPNTSQGLYQKYYVCRVDRTDYPGGKHQDCDYYVLDLTHDPYALETLHYYSRACEKTHPQLSQDLKRKVTLAYREMEDQGKL